MMNVVPPRWRLPGSLVMNPRCAYDVPLNDRPPVSHAPPVSVCVMNASCRLQYTAPFGNPVVPDVKMIATGRSGSSVRGGGAPPGHAQPVDHRARVVDREHGLGEGQHGRPLGRREPVVHARGDRAELGDRASTRAGTPDRAGARGPPRCPRARPPGRARPRSHRRCGRCLRSSLTSRFRRRRRYDRRSVEPPPRLWWGS